MSTSNKTQVTKDLQDKTIVVSRTFQAPLEKVWQAYTDSAILDQWWGPAPWRAETKSLDFRPGGSWLYAMVGPDGQKHWARMDYLTVDPMKSYEMEDCFCDEAGKVNNDMPVSKGSMTFTETEGGIRVDFLMRYASEAEVQQIVDMGFEQGIGICLDQLEDLLSR